MLRKDQLYDFLYDHDYPAWMINQAQALYSLPRTVLEWIMKLHTGETQVKATPDWSWEKRRQLGQQYLEELAEDILNRMSRPDSWYDSKQRNERIATLKAALELDGYDYVEGRLLRPETDVLDTQEEKGVLGSLFDALALQNKETAFHHLELSEEHYLHGRWDDSISNSRKFLESTLQEVAAAYQKRIDGTDLAEKVRSRPAAVRDFLEDQGLLETKEKDAIAKVYGLLSETGGHPYMAQSDQARLLRHLSLTLSQFVMLRLRGKLGAR